MLTKKQIEHLVNKVNPKVDLPILGEGIEGEILEHVIGLIDGVLDEKLPPRLKKVLNDASDGIVPGGDQDLQTSIDETVRFLNNEINIPLIGEGTEKEIYHTVVSELFEAMQKGNKLEE